tara:strand:- start:2206 stop:2721 length:516 start_codon:yes stop_codon:yes gene_type:complete
MKGKQMKLYLDMDGVLADFFGKLENLYNVDHWKDIPHLDLKLDGLKGSAFFFTLHKHKDADTLIEYAKAKWDWGICSSPLRGDRDNSAYWKRRWLEMYDYNPVIENMIFTANKHKYATDPLAGTPNILVDDKPVNIKRWEDAGGLGVLYQANEHNISDVIEELENIFSRES